MTTHCAKYNSSSFRIEEAKISGVKFKHYFVQCSSCGAPVGVLEASNTSATLEDIKNSVALNFSDMRKAFEHLSGQIESLRRRI
jgi:hypothetical protein